MRFRNFFGAALIAVFPAALAFGPRPVSTPELAGVVVTAPRVTFSISSDFKRDSLNRLFLYPGDTAVVSANAYNASGARVTTTAFRWNAENPQALAFKGTNQGGNVTLVALQPDSVTRIKVTWVTYNVVSYLTVRTKSLPQLARDTLTDSLWLEPNPIVVKGNDSVVVRVRALNKLGEELFDKNAVFKLGGTTTHDLTMKPFPSNTMAVWLVAGPCPLGVCTSAERGNAFLYQTAQGMRWMIKQPNGWSRPSLQRGS